MPCQYAENGNLAAVGTHATAITLASIAGLRPRLFGWNVGPHSVPNSTDCSLNWTLQLNTAQGTTTAVTPTPTDPGYQAAKGIVGSNASVEPTYTAGNTMWLNSTNQRASQLIWTPPNMPIVLVGTASAGIGMQVASSNYTGQADVSFWHEE